MKSSPLILGLSGIASAFILGMAVGHIQATPPEPQEIKPTTELLGEIAVDLGPGSPNHELFVEARADDARRAAEKAAEEKGAWR
jgi:hypothetical protein